MKKEFFGTDKQGNEIYKYTITDRAGNSLSVLNYGATVQSLIVKDKNGQPRDVVLGFDNLRQYENDENRTYFGAVCGRVAGRIKGAGFYVEGEKFTLPQNDGENCLHGGNNGFDKAFFDLTDAEENYMTFSLFSMGGEEGFPGNISLSVRYTLNNGLLMTEYLANTTASCPLNITNHSYFNLDGCGDITGHSLQLNSHFYLDCGEDNMPTGVVSPVQGTAFDFLQEKNLGETIQAAKETHPSAGGIDHYLFCDSALSEYRKLGTLSASDNLLKMDIFTNQPGVTIYTGNKIPHMSTKDRAVGAFSGIAIETGNSAAALEFSHLPSIMLHRGRQYYHKTAFRFYY